MLTLNIVSAYPARAEVVQMLSGERMVIRRGRQRSRHASGTPYNFRRDVASSQQTVRCMWHGC
eukprot:5445259-Pyramimonas_sp.AAC.1